MGRSAISSWTNVVFGVQYAFNLKTEVAYKRDGGTLVVEKLCLAFDELADAEKWRQAIAQQVPEQAFKLKVHNCCCQQGRQALQFAELVMPSAL